LHKYTIYCVASKLLLNSKKLAQCSSRGVSTAI
jgi:hypothetical protein